MSGEKAWVGTADLPGGAACSAKWEEVFQTGQALPITLPFIHPLLGRAGPQL